MSVPHDTDTDGGIDAAPAPRHPAGSSAKLGVVEWFRPGEHDRVEELLAGMARSGLTCLRTGGSWADCQTPAGAGWYDRSEERRGGQRGVRQCSERWMP